MSPIFPFAVLKKDRLPTISTLRNVMRKPGNQRTVPINRDGCLFANARDKLPLPLHARVETGNPISPVLKRARGNGLPD
jgi:hypothetical protein